MANNLRDRAVYVDQVRRLLRRLAALADLERVAQRYEAVFARVTEIYRSEGWRAEIPILRERVMPAQARFWDAMARSEERLATLVRAQADATRPSGGSSMPPS